MDFCIWARGAHSDCAISCTLELSAGPPELVDPLKMDFRVALLGEGRRFTREL
jgi:hypothetical protein